MLVLLIASYIFYGVWSVPFLLLILLTTSIDYMCAKRIFASADVVFRKRLLTFGITMNLLILCCFKYMNFLLASQHTLLGYLGIKTPDLHLNLILPLGISFYTFEAISYLIDVYRGNSPAPDWLSYNFYIMFFPHLVAGPIVRFNKLFPQYSSGITVPNWPKIREGLELIVVGFALKLIIADGVAGYSQEMFRHSSTLLPMDAGFAAAAFLVQIWLDFQGYTNIARGTGMLFNIELPINFHFPASSSNIANFWLRWNITLSRWLFDYLYVPLGGAKRAVSMRMRSAFLTMLIAGIWHGAGLNYVLMGAYFGALVAGYHAYRQLFKYLPRSLDRIRRDSRGYHIFSWLLTLYLLLPAGMLFNPDLGVNMNIIKKIMPTPDLFGDLFHVAIGEDALRLLYLSVGVVGLACASAQPVVSKACLRIYNSVPFWLRVQAVTVVVVLCLVFEAQQTDPSFIYAQF